MKELMLSFVPSRFKHQITPSLEWEGSFLEKKMKAYVAESKDISIKLKGLDGTEVILLCEKILSSQTCSGLIDNMTTIENVYNAKKKEKTKAIEKSIDEGVKDKDKNVINTTIATDSQQLLVEQIAMVYDNADKEWLLTQVDMNTLKNIVQDIAKELINTIKK